MTFYKDSSDDLYMIARGLTWSALERYEKTQGVCLYFLNGNCFSSSDPNLPIQKAKDVIYTIDVNGLKAISDFIKTH